MFRGFLFSLILILSVSFTAAAQPKLLFVSKVSHAPKLDGSLDDEAWQNALVATDFVINFPNYGNPSSHESFVKVVYDDEAIYIGAYLKDDPKKIKKQLTQRDNEMFQDADNFGVSFDTYNDKQNAFEFIVTSANVQSDVRISATNIENADGNGNGGFDYNWDAVWDSRTSIVSDGWIAEIKIPYSAIRFSKDDVQKWGVNFSRYIRRFNETSYWNPINPKDNGFVNQFGLLTGLQHIKPPLRLSFLPYVSTGYRSVPFNEGTVNNFLNSGGMDLKYGINESYTMDMTLVPDFGQVQSDNVVLNLSPFEQEFTENRPFFTEGTELFNKAGIFYSRRIGSTPSGYYDALQLASDSGYTILKNPSVTQLYNATKFSGRTKNGLGLGIFNAVTAPMYAEFENKSGKILNMETEPLANYNVFVADQSLKNRSYITFTNTNTIRNGNGRDGNVSALDLSLFNSKNTYNLQAQGAYSYITGTDPHNGFRTYASFGKVSGRFQWQASNLVKSKQYDPNDLGILFRANEVISDATISYQQFTPNKTFNFRNYQATFEYTSRFQPFAYSSVQITSSFLHVFKNFWDVTLETFIHPFPDKDYYNLRTSGRVFITSEFAYAGIYGSTDSRKKLFINYNAGYANFSPQKNDPYTNFKLGARYRFNAKFNLSINGTREFDKGNLGWALFDPVTAEPIIGLRQVTQYSTFANGTYNFKARMNLSLRVRHYWSKVHYNSFYNVDETGHKIARNFISGEDENFNAFNVDMFFTWDFRLGSRLIIAWKNALGPDATINGITNEKYSNNFTQLFTVPHSNEISVKFVYYIDGQNIFRKKK